MIAIKDNKTVEETICASRIRMKRLIKAYRDALPKEISKNRKKAFRYNANVVGRRLDFFNALTSRPLREEFTFVAQPIAKVEANFKRKSKNRANHQRSKIFSLIARTQNDRLQAMGLSGAEIEFMREYRKQPVRNGRPLDIKVEHLNPLFNGGSNRHDNIHIIPRYLNNFYAWLGHIQVADEETTHILAIRAREEEGAVKPFIPILPGGFRPKIGTRASLKSRTDELLGLDVPL